MSGKAIVLDANILVRAVLGALVCLARSPPKWYVAELG